MSEEEQIAICKVIAVSCMWGQGGVASLMIEELDRKLPCSPSWGELYRANVKEARRDHIGVITNRDDLKWYLSRGYWLFNWDEDGCSLFYPPPMNGLAKYVGKELADEIAEEQKKRNKSFEKMAAYFHSRSSGPKP